MKILPIVAVAGVLFAGSVYMVASRDHNPMPAEKKPAMAEHRKDSAKKPDDRPPRLSRWFKGADTDKDEKLTNAEFHAAHEIYFQKVDVNRDNILTPQEIREHQDRERAKRKAKKVEDKKPQPQPQ